MTQRRFVLLIAGFALLLGWLTGTRPRTTLCSVLAGGAVVLLVYRVFFRARIMERRFLELSRPVWSSEQATKMTYADFCRIKDIWTPEIGDRLAQMDYPSFLCSYYWRSIRSYVMSLYSYTCEPCGVRGFDNELHHETYSIRGREHLHIGQLRIMCRRCHRDFHGENIPWTTSKNTGFLARQNRL